jgi:aspartyl-tRNA(Asn)/glutamyl-tRNA(Gln) amidotransferase subunit A
MGPRDQAGEDFHRLTMSIAAQPEPDALADALARYARWTGFGDPARAAIWVDRLRLNREELQRFRDAPYISGPSYAARAVVPKAIDLHEIGTRQRMSGPDPATALRKARELSKLSMFTQLVNEVPPGSKGGYLRGAPFAIKDLIGVAGMQRTAGSASENAEPYPHDAASVAAIRRHGGVVIGLANLHELAFGASSANPVFGRVVNPAAPQCIPGGSSGGSAAAVAAGVVPVALGTDTGGSIRIPAACCGVVGFKPSYDAVPRGGVIEVAETLDHVGPIGRTVLDCSLAFAALSDLPEFPGLPDRSSGGLHVARLVGHFEQPLDPDVRAALDDACEHLRLDGARVGTITLEGAELASAIYFVTVLSEAGCEHAERLRQHAAKLGEDIRSRLEIAMLLPSHWYLKAQRMRRQLAERLDMQFSMADVLLCATMRAPAPKIGATGFDIEGKHYPLHAGMSDLTLPFNLAGLPAITIPWGKSREGVPIGIQMVGARGQDWKVLAVAKRLENLKAEPAQGIG